MRGPAYYNDNDPFCVEWLKELIVDGQIAPGDVDSRSIAEVRPEDLEGYAQCHFFAGIGGWSYALRLAGWGDDRPVWTASVPCQPLSGAGKRKGHVDERHLWPAFFNVLAERSPAVIFGEQVASPLGREWLAGIRADLESVGYAVGASDLPAASVGAPHIRQRLFWLADADRWGSQPRRLHAGQRQSDESATLDHRNSERLGEPSLSRLSTPERQDVSRSGRDEEGRAASEPSRPFWADSVAVLCRDGRARRIGTGVQPLAPRLPGFVGLLRGYGNAIVPQAAAIFIQAYRDLIE